MISDLVTARHLSRKAVIYIRQSTPHQVLTNQESLRLQYALHQRARDLGWDETGIQVIDTDLGLSGATATHREGFRDLIARVTLGEVGIVLSSEVTRLARNCSDWYPLLDLCGYRQCLIGDRDGVYDPGLGQWPPPLGPEGRDLGGGATHVAQPPDSWAAEQGRARRAGAAAAGRFGAQWRRSGGEGPG